MVQRKNASLERDVLSPQDRIRAVELLAGKQARSIQNPYNGNNSILEGILKSGFKGYSTFTDQQLLNGIQSFAKSSNDRECQDFLSGLSFERFVLE